LNQLALLRLAADDRRVPAEIRERARLLIKAEWLGDTLPFPRIGAVALEACVGKDWPDFAIEIDRPRLFLGG
jgi:hypothetical protein